MTKEEFEKKLEELHDQSFNWACGLCHYQKELAQDVLQDSYIKALNSYEDFKEQSTFKTWLFSIIRNCAYDYFRKTNRRAELDQDFLRDKSASKTASQEKRLRQKGDRQAAIMLLEQLSKREREVIELVIYQELKIKEAAEIMGVTLGSASSYLKRAKANMRGEILKNRQLPNSPAFEKTYTYQINLKKSS